MIFFSIVTIVVGLYLIYRKIQPFIEFSWNKKHSYFVVLRFLKAGYEDFYEKVLGPFIRDGYDSFWMGKDFTVILHNPEDIKITLNSEKCLDKPDIYKFFFKYGLLVENGKKNKQQRKSLNRLFSVSSLKSIIPMINKKYNFFLNENNKLLEDNEFDIKKLASKFTIKSIFATILGIDEQMVSEGDLEDLVEKAEKYLKSAGARINKVWLHSDFLFKFSKEYQYQFQMYSKTKEMFMNILITKNHSIDFNGTSYFGCMKDHLIKMDLEEFIESFNMFIGASFETTSFTISSALFLLASNPDKQDKLYKEISSILTTHEDDVTEEMIIKLKYLELVIKETLRLFPAGVLHARLATENVKLTNFTVPKQSVLLLPIQEIHRDKKIWGEDALEFKPERFEPENFAKIHPYAYFPFSGGTRMCPGYKYSMITMKIFISRFIMKYRIATNMKFEDLELVFALTTDFKKRPLLRLQKR